MTDETYPAPPRQTLADLDSESATTDRLIALARSHRVGLDYLHPRTTARRPAGALRALRDVLLTGEVTPLDAAYRLASIVDVVEGASTLPGSPSTRH